MIGEIDDAWRNGLSSNLTCEGLSAFGAIVPVGRFGRAAPDPKQLGFCQAMTVTPHEA
jgi:hypothetical protein